ncbi:unnamed protein product [Kluyveromyces dobzhanskii CBS 2104]|uniref:AP-3 complex subunit delta n=1 Tax=Kluyveromyces dobzhanskii CBS 2104 TaxID=1427455 RepID=A0A0A8L7D5_9SACH|nr:unnamed protein product [Kluyveromyces dobzhanskii CBS 2104]
MSSLYGASTEDVKKRLRPFGIFFEKSLKDLIKGIRSNNETPEQLQDFLNNELAECREEVKSPDFNMKTNAVLKLTYLEMYGFDMSWANFHILEVMSSNNFQQKRVGYLAASQSFYKDSDILMLATNLLKKDLKYDLSNETVKMGVALSGLSTIVTPELARDICDDLFLMLNSTKPYVRKKAVTALFKVFLQYPESLRDGLDRFVARLEDDDTSVISAAVSVICELAKHNPYPFVQFSPLLYEMLIQLDNNWIIIRLLKLFTNLSKVEPKLRYKLLPKVLELMNKTTAISVIYESINCIVKGQMLEKDDYDTAQQCLKQLESLVQAFDPNLRYISCVLFYHIGKINFEFITQYDKVVIGLLKDVDISIRTKALELCSGITSTENIKTVVRTLIKQFVDVDTVQVNDQGVQIDIPQDYKVKVAKTILDVCCLNNYQNIGGEFDWFLKILTDLCIVSQDLNNPEVSTLLGDNFRNIMVKVPSMRDAALEKLIELTSNDDIITKLPDLLKEGIWCFGEYSDLIDNCDTLITMLLNKAEKLPENVIQAMIPALVKLFSTYANEEDKSKSDILGVLSNVIAFMEQKYRSTNFDIQERSVEFYEMLKLCQDSLDDEADGLPLLITDVLPSLFNEYELGPVSHGQQQQLLKSLTLDLDTPFLSPEELHQLMENEGFYDDEDAYYKDDDSAKSIASSTQSHREETEDISPEKDFSMTEEELAALEDHRRQERFDNPFYLNDDSDQYGDKKLINLSDNEDDNELKAPKEPVIKISTKKKKSKNYPSVQVLSDIVVAPSSPDTNQDTKKTNTLRPSDGITLSTSNKLRAFDFSQKHDIGDEGEYTVDQQEIEKLRVKLAEQHIGSNSADADDNEEIIVIKKKKKKSKDKSSKEKTKKKKRHPTGNAISPPVDTDSPTPEHS